MNDIFIIVWMKSIRLYFAAVRPQFFPASAIPVALGAATAWHSDRTFHPGYFLLTLMAALLYHAGMNVINDYFDFLNGTDNINKGALTPFTGGARLIQNGLITPSETLYLALTLLTCGTLIGFYLVYARGMTLLAIGLIGLFTGVLYSAPPVFLAGRGLGEITVGLNFGVLTTVGSHLVQTGNLSIEAAAASLPISFLIAGVLYINQFPDYEADKASGKRNLVVRIGVKNARWGMAVIVASAYISIIAGVLAGALPISTLIALLSIFFAFRGVSGLIRDYDKGARLIPAIKSIIMAHTITGVLLTAAYIL